MITAQGKQADKLLMVTRRGVTLLSASDQLDRESGLGLGEPQQRLVGPLGRAAYDFDQSVFLAMTGADDRRIIHVTARKVTSAGGRCAG